MTFVITHTEGHLACFTVLDDGSLVQHALIDTGNMIHTPQQLVKLGLEMSEKYGWNGQVPKTATKAIAISKAKRAKHTITQHGLQRGEPPAERRVSVIRDFLVSHPGQHAIRDIVVGLGLKYTPDIQGRWNHFIKRMVRDGIIMEDKTTKPYSYSANPEPLTISTHIEEEDEISNAYES